MKYINQVRTNGPIVGSLKDVDFARLWFQVKLSPHLSSLSRDTLSCLSQSNLTCKSFQELCVLPRRNHAVILSSYLLSEKISLIHMFLQSEGSKLADWSCKAKDGVSELHKTFSGEKYN